MLWHQNSECQTTPTEFWCHGISGAKLHFADVTPLLEFGTKSLTPRLPVLLYISPRSAAGRWLGVVVVDGGMNRFAFFVVVDVELKRKAKSITETWRLGRRLTEINYSLQQPLFHSICKPINAEVLSGLLYRLRNSPPDRYAYLVAE
ncbi:hypothetical protein Tco_0467962, partial [Tanacetum coccineum]